MIAIHCTHSNIQLILIFKNAWRGAKNRKADGGFQSAILWMQPWSGQVSLAASDLLSKTRASASWLLKVFDALSALWHQLVVMLCRQLSSGPICSQNFLSIATNMYFYLQQTELHRLRVHHCLCHHSPQHWPAHSKPEAGEANEARGFHPESPWNRRGLRRRRRDVERGVWADQSQRIQIRLRSRHSGCIRILSYHMFVRLKRLRQVIKVQQLNHLSILKNTNRCMVRFLVKMPT